MHAIELLFTQIPLLPHLLLALSLIVLPASMMLYRKEVETTITNYLSMSSLLALIGTSALITPILFFTDMIKQIEPIYLFPVTLGIFFVALMDEFPLPIHRAMNKKLQPLETAVNDDDFVFYDDEFEDEFEESFDNKFPGFEEIIA